MMTTNKLTKTFASGLATLSIAAVSSVACSMLLAPSARALTFVGNFQGVINDNSTVRDANGTIYDRIEVGDKAFYNFNFNTGTGTGDVLPGDGIDIFEVGGSWVFEYDHQGLDGLLNGTIEYDVHIIDDPSTPINEATANLYFDQIDFDTETAGPIGYLGTKNVYALDDLLNPVLTLKSINGSQDSGSILGENLKTIKVVDILTSSGGFLRGLDNDFTQSTHKVPEPGTILGLLTVGGLGLVSRFKKQK